MQHEAERYLFDIRTACVLIDSYTVGLSFDTYQSVDQVRDSVERRLEIVGEAIKKLLKYHPNLAPLFPDAPAIIGMRNILSHEYGEVDDAVVWTTVHDHLPDLLRRVNEELDRRKRTKHE